jgi:hypothetical protein
MNHYTVTFHYTIEVEATDQEQADSLAWDDFANDFSFMKPGDFVSLEPDEVGTSDFIGNPFAREGA